MTKLRADFELVPSCGTWQLRSAMNDAEQRRGTRASLLREVTLRYADETISVTAMDLAEGGISVWGPHAAPTAPVSVTLDLDDGGGEMTLAGRVVREYESDGGAVWGIQFSELSDDAKFRLARFVAANAA